MAANCPRCNKSDPNYLVETGCWDKEACGMRAATYSNPEMQDVRDCFTTDSEQMYVALRRIIGITGHDHSNKIFEICIEALPPPRG